MKKKHILKTEKGMTLVEVIMALSIFTMGIAGFTVLFSRTWKSNSYVLEMGQSSMAVSQGMNRMVNYIRGARQADNGAYAVSFATDNELIVFSDYDKDGITERLHFYKNNQNILMGITDPTDTLPKTYPAGDQDTVTIVSGIVNDISAPIFYYYNKDYPADAINNPVTTPALAADVRLVKIYLEINIDPAKAPNNVKMQSFVEMRNLNDYDRI